MEFRTQMPLLPVKPTKLPKMKKLLMFPALIVPFLIYGGENETRVKSDIKEVTVFLSGAQVTSVGSATINPGTSDLVFENLSPNINSNSIQAKGEGDFTILSVAYKMNYVNQRPKTKEVLALEDSLEQLKTKLEMQDNLMGVYNNEEQMITANRDIGGNNNGVTAIELEKVATTMRTRLTEVKNKQSEIKARQKKLNESISKVNSQLNELNNKRNRNTGEIVITVSSNISVQAKLTLNYMVSNAGWSPIYDLRAADDRGPVKLNYRANVHQNTGVEWKGVKLTLSTGNPNLSGNKPVLNPWRISYYTPTRYKSYGNKNRSYAPAYGGGDAPAVEESTKEMSYESAAPKTATTTAAYTQVVTDNVINVQYEISVPYNVPADGKNYSVEIQNYSMPATYKFYCAPKLDKDAFLLARITGWDQYNLLPGDANIFYGGAYVGKSYIDTKTTNDTLDVSLGRDKGIVITRETVKELCEKKVIGVNKKESFIYEISIRNKKKQEIEIEVHDQVPLSSQSEIEVETLETSGAAYNKESGKLTWNLKIAGADTKKLRLGYSIKFPKDKVINY